MDTAIITALISAAVTLIGCIVNNYAQQRKHDEDQDRRMTDLSHSQEMQVLEVKDAVTQQIAVLVVKVDELAEKVEKHNHVIERTYKLERDIEVQGEKISVANHRISDLEKRGVS